MEVREKRRALNPSVRLGTLPHRLRRARDYLNDVELRDYAANRRCHVHDHDLNWVRKGTAAKLEAFLPAKDRIRETRSN
jgi:hypothetical protein